MVKLVAALALVLVLWSQGALAQTTESPVDRAIRQDPDRFAARMLDLIAGFGGSAGLTAQDVEDHVALERAQARATALRRFIAMDLDADGQISRAELATVQRAASATTRGRMERQFQTADADGDGIVDARELAAEGDAAARRALGEEEAELLRGLLALDADADGAVSAPELRSAIARMGESG